MTLARACIDCGKVGYGTRCRDCRAARERQRGSPAERGYGRDHRAARTALERTLPTGCGYCDSAIWPGDSWVAAHRIDGDPTAGWMVSHPTCNRRARRPASL